jgi:hypothetical protein
MTTNREWHHVPKKTPQTIGQRIAKFIGIEESPTITFRLVPEMAAITYTFPASYRLIASAATASLLVDYSKPKKVNQQIENVKEAEHPELMSPAIRAAELFKTVEAVNGIIVTPGTIVVSGGNPEDHQEALNGVAHEHSIFFGRAKIIPAEIQ